MDRIKHIVLLGAGAIGMLIAEKLFNFPGIRFTIAGNSTRIERYRRHGIFFNDSKLPLVFASPEDMTSLPPADIIIAATKTTSLSDALPCVDPLVNSDTIFLPLLNGITAHEVIADHFPGNTVLRGFFLGHASVRQNNRIYHDGVGTFYCGGEQHALQTVMELFSAAGINVSAPEDMDSAIWKKFILNVGINQTQAMFYADYGTVQKSPELLDFCRNLMLEALSIAKAENISGTADMITSAMNVITSMPPDVQTSMLQDITARRLTEVNAFAGTVCAKAEKYSIKVPLNRRVLNEITRREKEF